MKLHLEQAHQVTWIYTVESLSGVCLYVNPAALNMKNNWPFNQKNSKSKGSSMSMQNKT